MSCRSTNSTSPTRTTCCGQVANIHVASSSDTSDTPDFLVSCWLATSLRGYATTRKLLPWNFSSTATRLLLAFGYVLELVDLQRKLAAVCDSLNLVKRAQNKGSFTPQQLQQCCVACTMHRCSVSLKVEIIHTACSIAVNIEIVGNTSNSVRSQSDL